MHTKFGLNTLKRHVQFGELFDKWFNFHELLFLALTVQKLLAQTWVQIWTSGGAREFELKTPNLVWLMLGLSSISGRIRRRTLTDTKDAYAPSVMFQNFYSHKKR